MRGMTDLVRTTCFSMGALSNFLKLYRARYPYGLTHVYICCRIVRFIFPKILENNNTVQVEGHVTLKVFLGAKVEYIGAAFGTDDTFSTSVVVCHRLNSSDVSPAGSEPYLVILPRPLEVKEHSSHFLLTVYGIQDISVDGRTMRYVIKRKEIYDVERRITMDIDMEGNNSLFDEQDVFIETNDVLNMQHIFKESTLQSQCCDGTMCESMRPFYDDKTPAWPAINARDSASWVQGWATLCVLFSTALYFYSRVIIWLYVISQRGKDSNTTPPSKKWARDDQQGRLCRTS